MLALVSPCLAGDSRRRRQLPLGWGIPGNGAAHPWPRTPESSLANKGNRLYQNLVTAKIDGDRLLEPGEARASAGKAVLLKTGWGARPARPPQGLNLPIYKCRRANHRLTGAKAGNLRSGP